MVTKVCECCGHPMVELAVLHEVTATQRRMLEALIKAGRRGLTREQLVNSTYAFDINGGPLYGLNALSVQRKTMNSALHRHGLAIISSRPHAHGTVWRLESITEQGEVHDGDGAIHSRSRAVARLAHTGHGR